MVICLERGADLHMAQLMPLPLTVSCFSKIQIGFAFLVPDLPGSPGQRAVKLVCVCVRATQQGRHGAAMLPGASITVATCIFKYVCHLILVCECNILIYFVYFSASAETCVANVCTVGAGTYY